MTNKRSTWKMPSFIDLRKFVAIKGSVFFILVFVVSLNPAQGEVPVPSKGHAMIFEIEVVPGAERYLELLSYPPYLAVVLENNGIRLTDSGRIRILDPRTLEIDILNRSTVRFLERKGSLFSYQTQITWRVAPLSANFEMPAEVDVSKIGEGKVILRVYTSLARLLPKALTERINDRVKTLLNVSTQKQIVAYLDDLRQKYPEKEGTQEIVQLILLQAYNQRESLADKKVRPRHYGDAEPLSDQFLLLLTLAIWFVAVPWTAVLIFKWRRKSKA